MAESKAGGGGGGHIDDSDLDLPFEDEALLHYTGNLQLSLRVIRAHDLIDKGTALDKQDPMLKMTVAGKTKVTDRQKDAGTEASFSEKFTYNFSAADYRSGLKIRCDMFNQSVVGNETSLGSSEKSIKEFVSVLNKSREMVMMLLPYGGFVTAKGKLVNLSPLPQIIPSSSSSQHTSSSRSADAKHAYDGDASDAKSDEKHSTSDSKHSSGEKFVRGDDDEGSQSDQAMRIQAKDVGDSKGEHHHQPIIISAKASASDAPSAHVVIPAHANSTRSVETIIGDYETNVKKIELDLQAKREKEKRLMQQRLERKKQQHIRDLEATGMKRSDAEAKVAPVVAEEESELIKVESRTMKREVGKITEDLNDQRKHELASLNASSNLSQDEKRELIQQYEANHDKKIEALQNELATMKSNNKARLQARLEAKRGPAAAGGVAGGEVAQWGWGGAESDSD